MFPFVLDLISDSGVLIAFSAAISIIALAWMAGEFFSMPAIKGFARTEIFELGVSAVILLLALGLAMPGGPFDIIASGFMLPGVSVDQDHTCTEWQLAHGTITGGVWTRSATNPGSDAFAQAGFFLGCKPDLSAFAQKYDQIMNGGLASYSWNDLTPNFFKGVVSSKLALGYFSLMLTEMMTGILSGFYTSIHIPVFEIIGIDLGLNPWIAMTPLNQFHTIVVDLVGTTFASFVGQKMLLDFVEETMLVYFLPLGLLMRTFPFTRRTGSTIIAVVFAAYFVYPTSILINQQIFEMIANPQPMAGQVCSAIGHSCAKDLDCCSYDCRPKPWPLVGSQCVSRVADFSQYNSVFAICQERGTGFDLGSVTHTAQTVALSWGDNENLMLENVYFTGTASSTQWTKTGQRLKEGMGEGAKKARELTDIVFDANMINPLPGASAQTVFNLMEVMILDVGHFVLLALIFLVIEIVITLTLFKDFAMLIGGEPRLFGLSKLV